MFQAQCTYKTTQILTQLSRKISKFNQILATLKMTYSITRLRRIAEDLELNKIADSRKGQRTIQISINDLYETSEPYATSSGCIAIANKPINFSRSEADIEATPSAAFTPSSTISKS